MKIKFETSKKVPFLSLGAGVTFICPDGKVWVKTIGNAAVRLEDGYYSKWVDTTLMLPKRDAVLLVDGETK